MVYELFCQGCNHQFDVFSKTFSFEASSVVCEVCGEKKCVKMISMPQVIIGEDKPDRYERADKERTYVAKDRERAEKKRKKLFGTEGVSITKSPHYKKVKQIKAKGSSQDIDKSQFIKMAAQNPNAVAKAESIVKKLK